MCWISSSNRIIRDIFCNNTTSTNNNVISYGNSWKYNCSCPDENIVTYTSICHASMIQENLCTSIVSQNVYTRGQDYIVSYRDMPTMRGVDDDAFHPYKPFAHDKPSSYQFVQILLSSYEGLKP